jgi:tetratricopeptide (TPR) repeat protein
MVVGLLAVIALPTDNQRQWIVLLIVSMGLLAVGTVVGFLFGLPRSIETDGKVNPNSTAPATTSSTSQPSSFVRFLQTNNNLQKVSDWLTTVITGLTLTLLLKIPGYIAGFGVFLKSALGGLHDGIAIGAGMLLYFPSTGFAAGYLITRLVLTGEFDRTERALAEGDKSQVSAATSEGDFKLFGNIGAEPTDEQVAAAVRISQLSLSTLTTGEEKAAWARAQSILKNWSNAILGYQQAIVLSPNDSDLLEDYANALYESKASAADVVAVLDRALSVAQDPYSRARIMANKTQVYLDDGDYNQALVNIEQLLHDATLPKRARYFLYRARANGRKWAVLAAASATDPSLSPIAASITSDVKLALDLDPGLAETIRNSAAPANGGPAGDLSDFASQNPAFKTLIGM